MIKKNILFLIIPVFLLLVASCRNTGKQKNNISEKIQNDSLQKKITNKLYFGIDTGKYNVISKKIKRNQNLSDLLLNFGVEYSTIDSLTKFKDTFNIRQIRAGNNYHIFTTKADSNKPAFMVYEINKIDYATFGLDSIFVSKRKRKTHTKQVKLSAGISTSLWNAIVDKGKDPMIANDLSEIYAWTIDFFGLQKNDSFTVVYTEKYVDSTYVGIDTIYTSLFKHNNHNFYAFLFKQDGRYSYFDEKGNSLRKAFLKAPLKYSRISSRFSNSRFHPVLKIRRPHHGVDYAAPSGTPVHSIGDGKVIKKGWDKGGGNFIKIKHNSVYSTTYMHLKSFAKGIKTGDFVEQGQLIGYVGMTGLATGPHLDFRVYKNGHPIDPLKMEAPPVEPVKPEKMDEYKKLVEEYMKLLARH